MQRKDSMMVNSVIIQCWQTLSLDKILLMAAQLMLLLHLPSASATSRVVAVAALFCAALDIWAVPSSNISIMGCVGWSTCIYNIYMEPAMAKFVFSTAYSTVSWVLVLLL